MKIQSLTRLVGYSGAVREKTEERSFQQGNSNSEHPKKDRESAEGEDRQEASAETVGQAVEAFRADVNTQANGLNVSMEGAGPGLKVLLKDKSGGLVRSFTGEEFLRLREETSRDGRICGKILDQKL